jgi:hypothetical protein
MTDKERAELISKAFFNGAEMGIHIGGLMREGNMSPNQAEARICGELMREGKHPMVIAMVKKVIALATEDVKEFPSL